MPSASGKLEKHMLSETNDPVKQVITMIEKKARNLEKRKGKLDSYRQESQNGKELNEDQKKAVEKYDVVVELLEFTKELQKQFTTLGHECAKAQRKSLKREQNERHQHELHRLKEVIMYQDILNNMGGEVVRQDFLNGNKGAVKLTEDDLNCLDELYKAIGTERDSDSFELINDSRENSGGIDLVLTVAAEHLQALLDAKNKEAFGTTYKHLKEILQKIYSCSYFNKTSSEIVEPETNANVEENPSDMKSCSDQDLQCNKPENAFVEEDDFVIIQSSVAPIDRQFYPVENSSLYSKPPHSIQDVLSVQSNINFLQESQIELESAQGPSSLPATYTSIPYSASAQPISAVSRTLCTNEDTPNMVHVTPVTTQSDFDPAGPIPTQTFTNQSFSTGMQPMMGAPQGYVTMPILPSNIVVPPLPQRSAAVQPSLAAMTSGLASVPTGHSASGLSTTASALSQQANIYSLCLKMNQLNAETSQPSHIPTSQYNMNDVQESNVSKHLNSTFRNREEPNPGITDNLSRVPNTTYPRASAQIDYGNDGSYSTINNTQSFMNQENFDNSSYSSNLKRGLTSRGGSRNVAAHKAAANTARGGRVGFRN